MLGYRLQFLPIAMLSLALGATASTFRRYGCGIAQEIDTAAMTVYLKYQHYDADATRALADCRQPRQRRFRQRRLNRRISAFRFDSPVQAVACTVRIARSLHRTTDVPRSEDWREATTGIQVR
jgi:hypothetical protein